MDLNKLLKKKERAEIEGNQQGLAEICDKLGSHYINESKYNDALREYKEESDICLALDKKMDHGRANRMIGEVYMLQSQFKEALKYENLYLKIAKQENNNIEMQRAYATIGRCYLLKGEEKGLIGDPTDVKSAEKAFLKSLIISKELGRSVSKWELGDMQARLYLNLGIVKEQLKEIDEAINFYETAIKLCKANDLYELHHKCLMALSAAQMISTEEPGITLGILNTALEVAKRLPEKNEKMCETLLAKGNLLIKNGDFQSSKQVLKKAFKLKSPVATDRELINKKLKIVLLLCKCEDELVVTNSYNYAKRKELFEKLGDASCKLKNYSKAIDFYLKTLEAAQLNGEGEHQCIPIYVSLYQTYIDVKDYEAALNYMTKEYELIKEEPKEACVTLLGMGNLLDLAGKDFWEVETMYRRSLSEARKLSDHTMEKTVMEKLIKVCDKNKMMSLSEMLKQEAEEKGIQFSEGSEDIEYSEDILESVSSDEESLELLLSSDAESSEEEPKAAVSSTRSKRAAVTVKKNAKGETKLHEACIAGNYQLAKMLIDKGHALNVRDNAGWLPLHEAAINGHRDVVELLLDSGAQSAINDKGGAECDGITPLYDAASNGNLSIVQLLLDRGAKATLRTDFNETPLDALLRWHEDFGYKLSPTEKGFYEDIKQRLQEQCERVGIDTTTGAKALHSNSSGYESSKSRMSQEKRNLRLEKSKSSESSEEKKENEDDIKKNARLEYKNVMSRLKNPHKEQRMALNDIAAEAKRKSAHLTVEDVGVDEWLEDDLGPSRKKQRFHRDPSEGQTTSPIKSTPVKSLVRKPSSVVINSDSESDDSRVGNAFDVIMNAGDVMKSSAKRRSSTVKPQRRGSSSQPSVLDAGFARFVEVVDSTTASPPKHHPSFNDSFNRSNQAEKQLIIKVQVEDEKIIVPVNKEAVGDLKISWLIDETARRYYCLKGIRPELKLKTSDGATLLHTDPVSLILSLTDENLICSEILDWKLPSLSNRYLEACSELRCPVDVDVNESLEINRSAIRLDFSNQNFNPSTIRPVLKALQHQSSLLQLDLSSNFIQDEGTKFLSQTLSTLKHLQLLDVCGNMITETGVESLCSTLLKHQHPCELNQLKLSFNPIKSSSLKFISRICQCRNIVSLSLSSCELTDAGGLERMASVKFLDLSFNRLTQRGFKGFLNNINPSVVETLNVERASSEDDLGEILVQFIDSGCHAGLKEVNLAGLSFNENELLDILRSLDKCKQLKVLDLSHQQELTFLSFKYILFSMDSQSIERVKLIGCRNLQNPSNMFNLHNLDQQRRRNHFQHVQLSMPRPSRDPSTTTTRTEFKESMKELWSVVTGGCGRVDESVDNILQLIHDDEQQTALFY